MDIFKEKYEAFHYRSIKDEKERRFFNDMIGLCEKKCVNITEQQFPEKERTCFKNCSAKLFKEFLPIYEKYV